MQEPLLVPRPGRTSALLELPGDDKSPHRRDRTLFPEHYATETVRRDLGGMSETATQVESPPGLRRSSHSFWSRSRRRSIWINSPLIQHLPFPTRKLEGDPNET